MTPPIEQTSADSDLLANSHMEHSVDADPMNADVHAEESPEILRWRAELLLDEMMLGAVDASAGGAHPSFLQGANSLYARANPELHGAAVHFDVSATGLPLHPGEATAARALSPAVQIAPVNGDDSSQSPAPNRPQSEVVSVEERYARYASAQTQPGATTLGANGGNGAASAYPPGADYGAPSLGPVRRSASATLTASDNANAGAMSVVNRNAKYVNLLPRSTLWDAREMRREIVALHEEIDLLLPANHETRQRAHHLLEKANGILSSDPLRSAEVDYYLAQVRAIVQRVSQNVEWSAQYRQRLLIYLAAWVALSVIIIVGCLLYGDLIAAGLSAWFGWGQGSLPGVHSAPLLMAAFAGGLGGSLGALLAMRRSLQREYGFIDRKYSLRSLMLPIMGMIGGLLLYLLFGLVYWLLGLSPDQFLWTLLAPTLAAFAFGLFQESIYGTRE